MTTKTFTRAKRGPKTIGDMPMSTAERKRRSREQFRAAGGREFLVKVQGMHLEYVDALAQVGSVTPADALHGIVESALDRHVGIMHWCARMRENGASDEEIAQFVENNLMPELPPMPEKNGQ